MEKLFVDMCSLIKFDGEELYFPSSQIEVMNEYNYITENENYSLLIEKMDKLIVMLNETPELMDKDIETELWHIL